MDDHANYECNSLKASKVGSRRLFYNNSLENDTIATASNSHVNYIVSCPLTCSNSHLFVSNYGYYRISF